MLRGGISDPRNKALMKMFNLINIGERAGSGVPDIFSVWKSEGFPAPEVAEEYGPDRTILILSLARTQGKVTDRVTDAEKMVLDLIVQDPALSDAQMADKLSVSRKTISVRTRSLKEKGMIERVGSGRATAYIRLK